MRIYLTIEAKETNGRRMLVCAPSVCGFVERRKHDIGYCDVCDIGINRRSGIDRRNNQKKGKD